MEKEQVIFLMKRRLFGMIGLEEDLNLQRELDADPALQLEFERLRKDVMAFEDSPTGKEMSQPNGFDRVMQDVQSKKKVRRWLIGTIAAACLALMIMSLGSPPFVTGIRGREIVDGPKVHPVVSSNSRLLLTTASGHQLDLSTQKEWVIEGAKITNDGKTLAFTMLPDASNAGINKLSVPVGASYQVVLSDGSEVVLNAASTLEFPFQFMGDKREVTLKGEAFFKIAKNAHKRFIVKSNLGNVEVLGTSFNFNSYAEESVKVSLVEGAVAFTTPVEQLRLKPGETVTYNTKKGIEKSVLDKDDLLWQQGEYRMDNTSLGEMTELIKRWYGVTLLFEEEAIRDQRFTATIYRDEPLERFLQMLKIMSLDISFRSMKDTTILFQASSPAAKMDVGDGL